MVMAAPVAKQWIRRCDRCKRQHHTMRSAQDGNASIRMVSSQRCQFESDDLLSGFLAGPAGDVRVVGIASEWSGLSIELLSSHLVDAHVSTTMQRSFRRLGHLVGNVLANLPKLCRCQVNVASDGQLKILRRDERVLSNCLVCSHPRLDRDEPRQQLIERDRRKRRNAHAKQTRLIKSSMALGVSPKNGSEPNCLLTPRSAA